MIVEQTALFWSFLAVTGAGMGLSIFFWRMSLRRAKIPGSPEMTRALARNFHERVIHFTAQVRTLDEHANEYVSIFKSSEWNTLVETVSRLDQVDRRIQDHLRARQFDVVMVLLREVQVGVESSLDSIQASLDSYQANTDWEINIHGMLKRVVHNLEAATHETKELGSRAVTSRKRQPTLVTLADVKKTLLEDEVVRRGSNKT